jgi:hypothetical protein
MSRSPRDDWKHATAPRPGQPGSPAKPRRRSRLVFAVVPLLVAAGIAAGLFFFLRSEPKPIFLSLYVAEYDAWPVNAWAQQDGEALKQHFENGRVASQSQEGDAFLRELEPLRELATKDRQAVVIHICALAVPDGAGVSILPAKALPGSPTSWLPLASVLEAVGKIAGQRLLILDLRPVADVRLGQDGNSLAKALHNQLAAAEADSNLPFAVLAQSAPADYPYVSPELKRGALAEFLHRGLAGRADGWNVGNTIDKQVSAQELIAYAREWMAHWLNRHGAPAYLPVAYGKKDDFVLVTVPQGDPPDEPPMEPADTSVEIRKGWTALDGWRAAGAHRLTPRTYRQLEAAVMRADRLATGGRDVGVVDTDLVDRQKRLEQQRSALTLKWHDVASVGRARKKGIAKEAEVAAALQQLIKDLRQPAAKPEELKGKLGPFWEKPPEAAPFDAIVSTLLQAIVDGNDLSPEQLKGYLDALQGLKPAHLEVSVLAFFTDPNIMYRKFWPPGMPRTTLRAAIAAERAGAADGRTLKRIEQPLTEADAAFRKALLMLFEEIRSKWNEAAGEMNKLPARYEVISRLADAIERAQVEWEEAITLLLGFGDFSPEDPLIRQAVDQAWTDLVTKARRLRDSLNGAASMDELDRQTDELRAQHQKAYSLLREIPDRASPTELRGRLRASVWTAEERRGRASQATAAAAHLAAGTLRENVTVATGGVRTPAPDDPRSADAAARRLRRAGDLLALAGEPLPEANGWRAALAEKLVARYRKEADPAVRERFAWLIHPDDLPATPVTPDGPRNDPAADARRNAEVAMAQWLADKRLRPLADGLSGHGGEGAQTLARDLYEAARRLNAWRP